MSTPQRSCDGCTLCCRLPDIDALDKPANRACRHLSGAGCGIYARRPQLCRDFLCLWRTGELADAALDPKTSGLMIYRQGPQLTVLADPGPADPSLEPALAALAAAQAAAGGYTVLFAGDAVRLVAPSAASAKPGAAC